MAGLTVETLAVIPAKLCSRRLPRKVLADVAGKPMLYWTVDAALDSRISRVVISTESDEVARYADRLAVDVVADSTRDPDAPLTAVRATSDAAALIRSEGYRFDRVMMLLPTSPLRDAHWIDRALDIHDVMGPKGYNVVSTRLVDPRHGEIAWVSGNGATWERRPRAVSNGAIQVATWKRFKRDGEFMTGAVFPFPMPDDVSVDVDTLADLNEADRRLREVG